MTTSDVLGLWYCERVSQEQSDDEAEEFGEHDDLDREEAAAKTEFADATLELRADGSYTLQGPDWACSTGTWVDGDGFTLREGEGSTNGFDGLEYAARSGGGLVVAFKLVPDAHDGLDVLVLSFGRNPPVAKGPRPTGFIEQVRAIETSEDLDAVLDELEEFEGDLAARERELWDAWMAGELLATDPDSDAYSTQLDVFNSDKLAKAGGLAHAHVEHALKTVDYAEQRELFYTVLNKLALLSEDQAADAELAPLVTGSWLDQLVAHRFMGGGLPEALFHRRLVPQPDTDDASRTYMLTRYYTRFEAFDRLFPPGHPDAAKAAIRFRGRQLLNTPLGLIDARGLADESLAAALELLEHPGTARAMEPWLSAMLFVIVLTIRAGDPLPPIMLDNLAMERSGMVMGGLDDDEKATLRELITALPKDQRKLVTARFWLAPPKKKKR